MTGKPLGAAAGRTTVAPEPPGGDRGGAVGLMKGRARSRAWTRRSQRCYAQ
jgi:hypothetical protein